MSDTPRTDAEFSDDYYTSGFVRTEFAQQLERELAAAIAQRDKASADLIYTTVIDALDAAKELMDCKGYDLFPDGTMRPAHGLGEWVRAIDYDKLHAAAEAAQADAERYRWLRKGGIDHLLHGRLEELDDAIDAAMKEAAVVFNKTLTGCEIKLIGGGGGGGNT